MSWAMAEHQLGLPIFLSQLCSFSLDAGPNLSVPFLVHCLLSLLSCLPPCHVVVWLCGWLLCCLKCRGMAFLLSGQLLRFTMWLPWGVFLSESNKTAPKQASLWVYSYIFFYSYFILLRMRLWTPQGPSVHPYHLATVKELPQTLVTLSLWPVCAPYTCVACSCHTCVLHRFSEEEPTRHFQRYGLCAHFRPSKEFPKVIEIVLPTLFFLLLENT